MVPPFDDPWVIAGQGTVGLEILEQRPNVTTVFVPAGGGGLISGVSVAIKGMSSGVRIVGVEPEGAREDVTLARGGSSGHARPHLEHRRRPAGREAWRPDVRARAGARR